MVLVLRPLTLGALVPTLWTSTGPLWSYPRLHVGLVLRASVVTFAVAIGR